MAERIVVGHAQTKSETCHEDLAVRQQQAHCRCDPIIATSVVPNTASSRASPYVEDSHGSRAGGRRPYCSTKTPILNHKAYGYTADIPAADHTGSGPCDELRACFQRTEGQSASRPRSLRYQSVTIKNTADHQIQRLAHRGVPIVIEGHADAGYAWAIFPASRPERLPLGGRVTGASAFRRAAEGAQLAIDAWLEHHPDDERD